MKNARIIISIALVGLATTSFAQLSNLKDKLFHNKTYIHPVVYTSETAGLIDWTTDLQGIYENESGLEAWMSVPFATEEDLFIESWMAKPFYSFTETDDLQLESWMAVPFECGTPPEKWIVADNRNQVLSTEY